MQEYPFVKGMPKMCCDDVWFVLYVGIALDSRTPFEPFIFIYSHFGSGSVQPTFLFCLCYTYKPMPIYMI